MIVSEANMCLLAWSRPYNTGNATIAKMEPWREAFAALEPLRSWPRKPESTTWAVRVWQAEGEEMKDRFFAILDRIV